MEAKDKETNAGISPATCQSNDLTCSGTGILLWCLPIAALVVGGSWSSMRAWLWIPALLVMGFACLANAARCGRIHCYFTGPLFLVAALYVALHELRLAPMDPNILLAVVVCLTILAYMAERPLGRYRKRV